MHEGGGEPKSKGLGADGLLSYLIAGKNGAKMGHPHKGNDEGNGKGNRPTSAKRRQIWGTRQLHLTPGICQGLLGRGAPAAALSFASSANSSLRGARKRLFETAMSSALVSASNAGSLVAPFVSSFVLGFMDVLRFELNCSQDVSTTQCRRLYRIEHNRCVAMERERVRPRDRAGGWR